VKKPSVDKKDVEACVPVVHTRRWSLRRLVAAIAGISAVLLIGMWAWFGFVHLNDLKSYLCAPWHGSISAGHFAVPSPPDLEFQCGQYQVIATGTPKRISKANWFALDKAWSDPVPAPSQWTSTGAYHVLGKFPSSFVISSYSFTNSLAERALVITRSISRAEGRPREVTSSWFLTLELGPHYEGAVIHFPLDNPDRNPELRYPMIRQDPPSSLSLNDGELRVIISELAPEVKSELRRLLAPTRWSSWLVE